MTPELVSGVAAWLARDWGGPVSIAGVDVSTAGARRHNVFVEAEHAGQIRRLVVTVVPPALDTPLDVAAEGRVRQLARSHGVPVPEVLSVCSDASYVGAPFLVSERVDGETVPRRVHRHVIGSGLGGMVVEQLGAALAALHAIDAGSAAVALGTPGRAAPIGAALGACRRRLAALPSADPALAFVLRWLDEHRPSEPDATALLHTDARVGNLMVGPGGLVAILDWEGARLGDPMEDLAWPCTRMWRFGRDADTVGGLGEVAQLRDAYVAAGGGWDTARFDWWRVCGGLQWALELEGQARSFLAGETHSIVMAASGRRVCEVAFDLLRLTAPPAS